MGNQIVTLKNIIKNPQPISSNGYWSFWNESGYTVYDNRNCIVLNPNSTGMSIQNTDVQPIANHKYYGRITYNYNSTIWADNRFEWYAGDDGTNMVFACKENTNGQWVTKSAIESRPAFNGQTYIIRNFMVAATTNCYVTDMMIVDLSESFGLGNEPTLSWCDQNIPFFIDITYLSYTDVYAKVNGVWKQATHIYIKKNGSWIELNNPIQNGVSNIYKKVNGVWVNTI